MNTAHRNLTTLSKTTTVATIGATLLLVLLHFLESEFDPTWRMVSEYSNGPYGLLMRIAFLLTGIATFAIAMLLGRLTGSKLTKSASVAFYVSFVGLILATLFNQDAVTTKAITFQGNMHGVASLLGIPGFGIGALLAALSLRSRGAGPLANVVGYSTLVTFLVMFVYLFVAIPKETGFAPGTYTGALNRVVWVAILVTLFYLARELPKFASKSSQQRS